MAPRHGKSPAEPSLGLLKDLEGLRPKHRAFVIAYLGEADGNATAAYRMVYGAVKSADVNGPRLLGTAGVRAVVEKHQLRQTKRGVLVIEDLEAELDRLVHFDPAKLVGEDGRPLQMHELDEDTRRALSGVDVEELFEGKGEDREHVGTLRKWRWHDKRAAIELGLKRRGALVEKREFVGPMTVVVNQGVRKPKRKA